jgi:hypothetical protein
MSSQLLSNKQIFSEQIYESNKNHIIGGLEKMRKKKYHKNVTVLLTDETYHLLVEVTDELEKTLSEYLREMIEDKLCKINKEGRIE